MTYKIDGACLPVEFLVMGSIDNNVYFIGDGDTVIVVDPTCNAPHIVSALKGHTVRARALFVVVNTVVDIIYGLVNPMVRISGKRT